VPTEIYIYISPFIIPHFAGFVNQNFYADPIVLLTSVCDPPDPTLQFYTAAAGIRRRVDLVKKQQQQQKLFVFTQILLE
jgi:hypothetical protein